MGIHLVRHAKAGSRPDWSGDDEARPLTDDGVAQSHAIAALLAPLDVVRIVSSRYVRCVQTVEPLAAKLGIDVVQHASLAEEANLADAWGLVEGLIAAGEEAVVCSHGNILSPILDRLHRRGLEVVGEEWTCKKGSVWTIELDGSQITRVVQTTAQA